MSVEGSGLLCRFGINLIVVVFPGTIVNQPAFPDDDHAVDIAVFVARDVGFDLSQNFRIETDRLRRRRGPPFCRPLILR